MTNFGVCYSNLKNRYKIIRTVDYKYKLEIRGPVSNNCVPLPAFLESWEPLKIPWFNIILMISFSSSVSKLFLKKVGINAGVNWGRERKKLWDLVDNRKEKGFPFEK